jgi:6-phosphofructokinase 1
MKKRIGILTSGGDCPGLNAAIRGVARAAYELFDAEILGIRDGYRGLIEGDYQLMDRKQFSGILTLGGTILGTSRQPFRNMRVIGEDNVDKVAAMKDNYKAMRLDCLVTLGGNGTHKTANLLSQEGLNIIGLPKTIDNDLYGTDFTFGFHTAVDIATEVIDRIHTTASSHGRCMVIELMGNKTGWLTLYAGVAGGADVVLLPEIPYDIKKVAKIVESRASSKKPFSIIAVAEGAMDLEESKQKKKEREAIRAASPGFSIAARMAAQLSEMVGVEEDGETSDASGAQHRDD